MIVIFSILHYFGLAERVAKALNARRANKTLWKAIEIVGILVALGIVFELGLLSVAISKDKLDPISITTFTMVPALIALLLIVFEIVTMAGWFNENRKLSLCEDGSWVMFRAK